MTPGALAGKTAVVTGPTSGIGRGTALELARLGATVVLVARSPDKCALVSEAILRAGGAERQE